MSSNKTLQQLENEICNYITNVFSDNLEYEGTKFKVYIGVFDWMDKFEYVEYFLDMNFSEDQNMVDLNELKMNQIEITALLTPPKKSHSQLYIAKTPVSFLKLYLSKSLQDALKIEVSEHRKETTKGEKLTKI